MAMTRWLYRIRYFLIAISIGFGAIFAITILLHIDAGNETVSRPELYKLMAYWWMGLISFYAYAVAATLHGKSRDRSPLYKAMILAFPTLFVGAALYGTISFMFR